MAGIMKELESKISEGIEISAKKQQEKQYTLVGNIIPYDGHTIFEINKDTLEVVKAKFISSTYYMFGDNKKEVAVKQNCAYVSALNEKNAIKKYLKGLNGGRVLGTEKLFY